MASLTRLNRRLKRWQRYDRRVRCDAWSPGHRRASGAVEREQRRRQCRTLYWPLGDHLDRWGL